MKLKLLPIAFIIILSGCSNWINGNKILADKNMTDQQINSKIVDNKTTMKEVTALFGDKKQNGRNIVRKSFPNGTYDISSYQGHLNDLGGTYARRVLFVAYDKNGIVINHDIAINYLREKNKFEKKPNEMRLSAFNELNKNDSKSKVLTLLGAPRSISFSDSGNVLLVYNYTEISRDASSYIPVFNMIKGTESGTSELVYIELKNDKVENVYLLSVNITQGRGMANAADYKEDIIYVKKKYDQ